MNAVNNLRENGRRYFVAFALAAAIAITGLNAQMFTENASQATTEVPKVAGPIDSLGT